MNTNNIIDAELTNSNELLSGKTLAIIKTTGVLGMILGAVSIFQILSGLGQILTTIPSLFSFGSMGVTGYYIVSSMFNTLVNITLNGFFAVFLFRYAIFATKGNKRSFGDREWEFIFQSVRNILVTFGLMNISWLFFSILSMFIGLIM